MRRNRWTAMWLATIVLILGQSARAGSWELVESRRIWDAAPHNAFTDLIRFKNRWFCVFREGQGHVSPDGALRVIVSDDGTEWTSAARLTMKDHDLRDAKISIDPQGRLVLLGAGARHGGKPYRHQSFIWLSEDGKSWSEPKAVGDANFWLWRITWHDGRGYGFGYGTTPSNKWIRLYRTTVDGEFETFADKVFTEGYPNETEIVFEPNGRARCLLRRDGGTATAQWGTAMPPYRDWTWQDIGVRIGGPSLLRLPNGRWLATVRLYDGGARTSLCELDPETGRLTESLRLPSGGDTSYAGMVWHDGMLWISYYSSHEGRTMIYLAKVRPRAAAK